MYLPQAVSLPPSLGIESDLFPCNQLAQEDELEPAVGTCSATVPLFRRYRCNPSTCVGEDRTFS